MVTLSKFGLEDKVAIVTGAGRGIGKSIAISFSQVGAQVVVAEIDATTGRATTDEIRALGRKTLAITADVRDSKQVARLVDATVAQFGRIDILVNNVGGPKPLTPIVAMKEEDWDEVVNLNLKSAFLCSKAVGRVMIEQNKGNIINVVSMAGLRAVPGLAPYAAAKAGMISLTLALAAELARYHIRVNAIAPGTIEKLRGASIWGTTQEIVARQGIPLGIIGQPDDIAAAAIYLASEASSYLSGHIIEVKGGPYTRKGDMEMFIQRFPTL